jgi:hypothetical protein
MDVGGSAASLWDEAVPVDPLDIDGVEGIRVTRSGVVLSSSPPAVVTIRVKDGRAYARLGGAKKTEIPVRYLLAVANRIPGWEAVRFERVRSIPTVAVLSLSSAPPGVVPDRLENLSVGATDSGLAMLASRARALSLWDGAVPVDPNDIGGIEGIRVTRSGIVLSSSPPAVSDNIENLYVGVPTE